MTETLSGLHDVSRMRLLHLISPALPIGTYSYSQGLETAVEKGWLENQQQFHCWLAELIAGSLAQQELPLLFHLNQACQLQDSVALDYYSQLAVALRDTAELRSEERARGAALLRIISALPDWHTDIPVTALKRTPLAGIAWAAAGWQIETGSLLSGYAHTWLESQIVTAVKLIPLGQTQGQQLQYALIPTLAQAVEQVCAVDADDIGYSTPAVSMASSWHETQYSRVYRS